MLSFKSSPYPFQVLHMVKQNQSIPQPLLRDDKGSVDIYCVSPLHGRSFVVGKNPDGRWVISKGNGLSYSFYNSLNTSAFDKDTWGLLLNQGAIRDFTIGQEIQALGIKTNQMEYVLEIDKQIKINSTGETFRTCLLQYNVECPYRVCDFAFMPKDWFQQEIIKWQAMNEKCFKNNYLIAANVLIRNLRIMHDNHVMHNSIHIQNYTWALELLDFESSRTDKTPYSNNEYERNVLLLITGEIIKTYEIINYIAWCLNEDFKYNLIDKIFEEYGFDLKAFSIS